MNMTHAERVAYYDRFPTHLYSNGWVACGWRGIAFIVDANDCTDGEFRVVPTTVHIEDPDEFRDHFGDGGLEAADDAIESMPSSLRDAIAEHVTERMADYWEDSRLGI